MVRLMHRIGLAFIAAALIASITACAKPPNPQIPDDPKPIAVDADQATTFDLGGGAHLIIPPGAIADGATVSATYQGAPDGIWQNGKPISPAVELRSDPPDAIHGLLTLEFPVPIDTLPDGADPADVFGLSTYDPDTGSWVPYTSTYDTARHMVVAQIPHFSWWNPFSWDWAGIAARVNQNIGQLVGRRAGNVTCNSGQPTWVRDTPGIADDAGLAIRSCGQNTRDLLDVQIMNNRPYGQVLTYGSAVDWGWHAEGGSASEKLRNGIMDRVMKPNQLYIPPLSAASVGIKQLAPNASANFVIGPSRASITADLLEIIAGQALDYVPTVGNCASYLVDAPYDDLGNMASLRDLAINAADCLTDLTKQAAAQGALDGTKISQIESVARGLRAGSVIGVGWTLYGAEWQVADLFIDRHINTTAIRNGFSVYSKSASTPPPTTQPPTNPPAVPKPTLNNFAATVKGPGSVQVTFNVGWQSGRAPVTCHFYIDGAEAFSAVCGTSSSKTFTNIAPGSHQFAARVSDKDGVWSDWSSTLTLNVPAAPPPPQQQSTYPETTAINTNTWTNYTNAGGTQGATIPAYTTVQISCWLEGFRVRDGNTYWYRIASSPWNNAYYASADAFYNNGATSGPLAGTPFKDDAVPHC